MWEGQPRGRTMPTSLLIDQETLAGIEQGLPDLLVRFRTVADLALR